MFTKSFLVLLSVGVSIILTKPIIPGITPRQDAITAPFSLIAARSGSPIHLQSINANNASFWIGKETISYCPENIEDCPAGTITAIDVDDTTTEASMDTEVPGGQYIYVLPTGVLAFTPAHSEGSADNGTTTGFSYVNETTSTNEAPLGYFTFFLDGAAVGWLACPETGSGGAPYQIFADVPGIEDGDVPGGNLSSCLGLDILGDTVDGVEAWQYE